MKHRHIINISVILAAALLISGCDTPAAPAVSVSEETESSDSTDTSTTESFSPDAAETDNDIAPLLFSHKDSEDEVTITGWNVYEAVIPETVDGKPVTKLSRNFLESADVTRLVINAQITELPFIGNCPKLKEIVLPPTLTEVSADSFSACPALRKITVSEASDGTEQHFCSKDGVLYTADMKTLVYAPKALANEYSPFTVPETVTEIAANAFLGSQLTSVILPDGLKKIGKRAFRSSNIVRIDIPADATEIGDYAFSDSGLWYVTMNDILEMLGSRVFDGTKVRSVVLPDTVKDVGMMLVGNIDDANVIEAPLSLREDDDLNSYAPVVFRGEPLLEEALRRGNMRFTAENVLYTDVNYDDFPEAVVFSGGEPEIYYYSEKYHIWNQYYIDNDPDILRADPMLAPMYEEWYEQNKTEFPAEYGDDYGFDGYFMGVRGTPDFLFESCWYRVNATGEEFFRTGNHFFYSDGESVKSRFTPDECTLITKLDYKYVYDKYSPIGKFKIYDSLFAAEPFGEKPDKVYIGGGYISEFPYSDCTLSGREKVLVGGEDLLRGGQVEGASFNYMTNTLTLDNVSIEQQNTPCIDFRGIISPVIELKGENRLVSEVGLSVYFQPSDTDWALLTITGDGSLETGTIGCAEEPVFEKKSRNWYRPFGTVVISGEAKVSEGIPGRFAKNVFRTLKLQDGTQFISGSTDERSHGIRVAALELSGSASLSVFSDENGVFCPAEWRGSPRISLTDSAEMVIGSAKNGIDNSSPNPLELILKDTAVLDIRTDGIGINFGERGTSTAWLSGSPTLKIRSVKNGFLIDELNISGGTIDCVTETGLYAVRAGSADITGQITEYVGSIDTPATQTTLMVVSELPDAETTDSR